MQDLLFHPSHYTSSSACLPTYLPALLHGSGQVGVVKGVDGIIGAIMTVFPPFFLCYY